MRRLKPTAGQTSALTRRLRPYGLAALVCLAGVALALSLFDVSDAPIYAPLVAAAAVSVLWLGLGPGLVGVAVAWVVSLWALVEPRGSLDVFHNTDGLTRWGVNLAVALGLGAVIHLLRGQREEAEAAARDVQGLQELTSVLSASATSSDIANALITQVPGLIGARGGAVALLDGDTLEIVDPHHGVFETHRAGTRLPLSTRAPIAQAARGAAVVVRSRDEFERDYPDGVRMTSWAQAAVAAPLVVSESVVGSASFLFDDPDAVTDDARAIVLIAVELGGQALERASQYERELETRHALDRLLRVAPTFHTEDTRSVSDSICREARTAFGSDYGVLWSLRGDQLELLASDPVLPDFARGHVLSLGDFPHLREAVGRRGTSFVENVVEEAHGAGLDLVRRLGIRSSLRTPIAVEGRPELLLSISWRMPIPEPDTLTMLVARRFADQAGLALAQLERRRAEAEAERRADEAQRLKNVTAGLASAATPAEVSSICLQHAAAATSATAGVVLLRSRDGSTFDLSTAMGIPESELEAWSRVTEDEAHPLSRAIMSGEPVWPDPAAGDSSTSLALPLDVGATVGGALYLALPAQSVLGDDARVWLETVLSQCAQALERSRLFDEEQHLRRRSELLQRMTTRLSNAVSLGDVAEVVLDQALRASGADGGALAVVSSDRQTLEVVGWSGYPEAAGGSWFELPVDASTPATRAIRRRSTVGYGSVAELRDAYPEAAGALAVTGHEAFVFVPLVAGREARAVLALSWADEHELSADERSLVESLAGQAAQAIDRAAHFEWERNVAETLQRSVLPASLPRVEGVSIAARYLPGTAELLVGGDWFDAIPLRDGKLGLVVGDVVGKGVGAAAAMAQLRNALRAFSLDRLKPSSAIARLNRLAHEALEDPFATVVYAVLDPDAGVCRITSAGHPPPILAFADGGVGVLEGAPGLPLGVSREPGYRQQVVELPAGSVLVLYTDGLIERRDRSIDAGIDLLRQAIADGPREPEALVEHIVERMIGTGERADDVALVVARFSPVAPQPLRLTMPVRAESSKLARDSLRSWLTGASLDDAAAYDVMLAAWEACVNAVEHGREAGAKRFSLAADVVDSEIRIRVRDDGAWIPPRARPERGLGLELMRSLMSTVTVDAGREGTLITLTKAAAAAAPGAAARLLEEPDQQDDDHDQRQ